VEHKYGRKKGENLVRSRGDYLEVMFDQKPGYFRETASDQVMQKADEAENILGFSILKVSALKRTPLEVALWASATGGGESTTPLDVRIPFYEG
jgi:hypothetical protein